MEPQFRAYRRTVLHLVPLIVLAVATASCLKELPEDLPGRVEWDPELAVPLGRDSFGLNTESGFDTTLLELDTLTELPGWIQSQTIVLEGDLHFDLSTISDNLDDIQRMLLRVNFFNGFPNEAHAQGFFLDAGSLRLDSVFEEGPVFLPPATAVGSGQTTDPSRVRRDARFEDSRLVHALEADRLQLQLIFRHPDVDTALIPYYPGYQVEVDAGIMLDLNMEFQ